jgi:hypothetical protein
MTTEEMKAELEAQEKLVDEKFVEEINLVMRKYNRNLVASPIFVPDTNGMKISAQITVKRDD